MLFALDLWALPAFPASLLSLHPLNIVSLSALPLAASPLILAPPGLSKVLDQCQILYAPLLGAGSSKILQSL